MKVEKVPFELTAQFSQTFIDYIKDKEALKSFYGLRPETGNFIKQISLRNFPQSGRDVLVETLQNQYKDIEVSELTNQNILSLKEKNTFTVTTGHQLNIFTGPLYFIFKIVTAIESCRELQAKFPEYRFVPVYWMASEDHDFDEISYFYLFGKKYEWKTNQTGAVGRFDPKELREILNQLPGHHPIFEKAYLKHKTLAEAVRFYVNELFKEDGLVVIDADDKSLKQQFRAVMKTDVFDHIPEQKVAEATSRLVGAGYHEQIHARKINFFYLDKGIRNRIERDEQGFAVIDSELKFSTAEMESLINDSPEKLSPNVILRPLYQEMILPNLAYIGGPSEVTYWFQLKEVFNHFNVPFPILLPRNFGLVINKPLHRKWEKTGFGLSDLFRSENELSRQYALDHANDNLIINGKSEEISKQFQSIREQATVIDVTLGPAVEAWQARTQKALDELQKKMIRAEKRKHSDINGQITAVKDELFPSGGLQERRDNFLNFYMENPDFIEKLKKNFDPFDLRFHLLLNE